MQSIKKLFIILLFIKGVIFSDVYVSPNPGYVGDEFTFYVTLNEELSPYYESFYIRLFDGSGGYYDHKMNSYDRKTWYFSTLINKAGKNREFALGVIDGYGEIHWINRRWTYTVLNKELSYADAAYQNATRNLNKRSGYVIWNGVQKYGIWTDYQYTYCARFVRMCFGKNGKYSSAIQMYNHFNNYGLINTYGTPPKGAVIFYDSHKENGYYGHTGISDGNGGIYSVTSRKRGVTHLNIYSFNAPYLGYVTAEDFYDYY